MRGFLFIFAAVLALGTPAVAENARPAGAAEFGKLLFGCWKAGTPKFKRAEGIIEHSEACFDKGGIVHAFWSWGSKRPGVFGEGLDGDTKYQMRGGKLVFTGPAGWIQAYEMSCDAFVVPGSKLELLNCVDNGVGPDGIREHSTPLGDFVFRYEPGESIPK